MVGIREHESPAQGEGRSAGIPERPMAPGPSSKSVNPVKVAASSGFDLEAACPTQPAEAVVGTRRPLAQNARSVQA